MKIFKIVSDGTPEGSHVYDEVGKEVEDVESVEISMTKEGILAKVVIDSFATFVNSVCLTEVGQKYTECPPFCPFIKKKNEKKS